MDLIVLSVSSYLCDVFLLDLLLVIHVRDDEN